MKINMIFIFSLVLITIMSMAVVSAVEDNSTISDNQTLQSVDSETISADLENEILDEDDEGTYLDPSEAYECLNEFRTEDGAWFWAPNNVRIVYFNTHEANQLKPLLIDPELEKTAQIRAKEISVYFEHERPDGTMCFDIYPDFFTCGENIAIASTGKEATEAWKEDFLPYDEQGHRHNMLNGAFQYVGIAGYRDSNGVAYWVQAFGGNYSEPINFDDKTQRDESKGTLGDLNNLIASNDMISLDKDYEYFNDSALAQGIIINKSLTFNGNGHSIDAKGFARIFNVSADDVLIKNTRFLNAYMEYIHGGAIYSGNFNVTLINCSFINNFAYYGAAVASTGGALDLIDCSFADNWAVEGALYAENTAVKLTNCKFKNNSAILYGAGACINDGSISLTDCIFENNLAGLKGGAISAINSNVTNVNSIFARNDACIEGGAIYLLNATIASNNCNFLNNSLTSTYYAYGAALYGEDSSVSYSECSFSENRINLEFGSANGGALFLLRGDSSFNGCNFTNNFAKVFGGALCLINNTAAVNRCKFNRNSLEEGQYISTGGAIYGECTNISVADSSFMNNFAHYGAAIAIASSNIQLNDSSFSNNTAALGGGAVHSTDGNATIAQSEFLNNSAVFSGGALSLSNGNVLCDDLIFTDNKGTYGGALHLDNAGFHIIKSNFEGNIVDHEYASFGGALHVSASEGSVELCSFTKSNAYSIDYIPRGAAICFEDSNVSVENCNFTKNMAYYGIVYANKGNVSLKSCRFSQDNATGAGIVYMIGGFGLISNCIFSDEVSENSVAYLGDGVFNIINSQFTNVSSKYSGGAICSYQSEIFIEECGFSDISGSAEYYSNGGAVSLNDCDVFISNSNFTHNSATGYGGAAYLSNCYGSIEGCNFKNNTINSINYYVYGGAVHSINGNMSISDCIFEDNCVNNTYYAYGGAVALQNGNSSVFDCIFTNNHVTSDTPYGGALYCGGGNLLSENNDFRQNTAGIGGAVACENADVSINDSTFENNTVYYDAGAVFLNCCNASVNSCDFSRHQANYGGAIYSYTGNLSVIDSSFTDCMALFGGAIYSAWSNSTVTGSNFTNNSAEEYGGALYCCNAADSTFTNNTAKTAGAIYGENHNAIGCRFIGNVAYADNPAHDVNTIGCIFIDNKLITKATIEIPYLEDEYYLGDRLYVYVYARDYPYQAINNATVTVKVFKSNVQVDTFDFESADNGWIVNLTEGDYFAEFSIESDDFEVNNVNITFKVAKKEIATIDMTFGNYTFSSPVVVGIQSNVDAYAEIYIDGNYIDYLEMSGNETLELTYTYLQSGVHTFRVVSTPKNSKIDPITVAKEFEVFKKETSIKLDVNDVTDAESVIVSVQASEGGAVSVKVGDVSQSIYVYANTESQIDFGVLPSGRYTVEATLDAGDNYITSSDSKMFSVLKEITQEDIKISKDGSKNIAVNLPSGATGTVTLTIAGQDYDVEIINGVAEVTLPDLGSGEYPYVITYSGDENYSGFSIDGNLNQGSSDESPKINPNIVIPEFNEGSQIELPKDAGGTVTLTVDGKDYVFEVINGVADVKLPDLANGAYEYSITYSGDGKYSSFAKTGQVTVERPIIISAKNLNALYTAGPNYQIIVKNDLGIPAEGASVVIKLNGKAFKTLTTDSKGVVKFKVTQVPGTYKVQISALGASATKTLTVKHLVTLKSVTVKKSAKKLVLTATLAKVNGKYLKSKKVTFKFNGKKYVGKTNKKGVAKVTIKSSVLKKLKVAKKVTYQATYLKDTVKKTAKIKK